MNITLEIARGLASLWVFFYHAGGLYKESSDFIYVFSRLGHLGVPLFFVISGYVITYSAESTRRKRESPVFFLKKRFLRIYPTFWASIIIVLAVPYIIEMVSMLKSGTYILPESRISQFNISEWFHFITLTKVFFSQDGDLQAQFNAINSVYWSLAIEFQFYLLIFLALYFGRYYKLLILGITVLSLINLIQPFGLNYGFFLYYWPMFASGVILAYIHKSSFTLSRLTPGRCIAISAIFFPLFIFLFLYGAMNQYFVVNDSFNDLVFNFIFSLFAAFLFWLIEPMERVLVNINNGISHLILKCFIILGSMSYSIYLLHAKIFQLLEMFVRQVLEKNNILYGLLTMILTLILCYPFYLFIERKFMSKKYKKIVTIQ